MMPSSLTTPVGLYPHVQRGLEIFKLSYNPRGYKSKSPKSIDIQMGTPIASSSSSKHLDEAPAQCLQVLICTKRYISLLTPMVSYSPCADRPSDFDFAYNPWGYKPINTVSTELI